MAYKKREVRAPKDDFKVRGVGRWATPGQYIAGAAHIDECDLVAREVEARWGSGRVRLLVDVELREKFDRQRYLMNRAIWHGDLEDIRRESRRMIAAWRAVDRAASASGAEFASPEVWEIAMGDGRVLALARTADGMQAYARQVAGRSVVLWSLEEVARLIEAEAFVSNLKVSFPGAKVEVVRTSIDDPLAALTDAGDDLDEVPF